MSSDTVRSGIPPLITPANINRPAMPQKTRLTTMAAMMDTAV